MQAAFCSPSFPLRFSKVIGLRFVNDFTPSIGHFSCVRRKSSCHRFSSTPALRLVSRSLNSSSASSGELPPPKQAHGSLITTQPSAFKKSHSSSYDIDHLRGRFEQFSKGPSPDSQWLSKLITSVFPYNLDKFQQSALAALSSNQSLVLSAPTGAGKTIVGEMAVYLALCRRLRVFYTTPLKALSNQKFYDFKRLFGDQRVGLLTGDVTVNRDADVLVMTTEIYRNMLYADSSERENAAPVTDDLFAVVFDEFHFLNDRDRGTVWEESVIHSPSHVLLVALSATMSNTADVRDWFASVQGPTTLVESHIRPVPLNFGYCDHEGLTPLFADKFGSADSKQKGNGFAKKDSARSKQKGKPRVSTKMKLHPKLLRKLQAAEKRNWEGSGRSKNPSELQDDKEIMQAKYRDISSRAKRRSRDRYKDIPSFPFVVRTLRRRDMLPCIVFIFSRAGCDRAANMASSEHSDLVSRGEQEAIKKRLDAFVEMHPGMVQPERLNLALQGIASHHAGLLPLWKICVEELFQDGLIKVVFATETLAAGINMPARTTVIASLSKRAGEEGFKNLTTSEVLQMAGRAGRRGKDVVGHSLVLRSRNEGALEAFKVLTADVDALESKFTPDYGMVLNLLSACSLEDAKKLVDRSFGNFLFQKYRSSKSADKSGKSSLSENDAMSIVREKEALKSVLADAQKVLQSVDEKELRSFIKNIERVKAENRALAYLVQQSTIMDSDQIEDTLTFAPSGTRLLLKEKKAGPSSGAQRRKLRRDYSSAITAAGDGDLGIELKSFYLDVTDSELEELDKVEEDVTGSVIEAVLIDMYSENGSVSPMFAAVDANGRLRLFNHTAVSQIFYEEDPMDIESIIDGWGEEGLPARAQWTSIEEEQFTAPLPKGFQGLVECVEKWRRERKVGNIGEEKQEVEDGSKVVSDSSRPEMFAQLERVKHAKRLVRQHGLYDNENIHLFLAAKRAVPKILATLDGSLDPYGRKRRKTRRERSSRYREEQENSEDGKEMIATSSWDEFMRLVGVLQHYGFIDDSYDVTSLGSLGAKVRSDNELWSSLVLLEPDLENVSPLHLGAILGACQSENVRADVYIAQEVSKEVKEMICVASAIRVRLHAVQSEFGVDCNICLDGELMGLVEMWSCGMSWMELLSNTSLQEGDACRILRRALDLLRQVQHLPVVSEGLKKNARRAIALMDRFPVTDDRTYSVRRSEKGEFEEE